MKFLKNKGVLSAFAISTILLVSGCSPAEEASTEIRETPVAVGEAFTGSLSGSNQLTGTAKAASDIHLIPKAAGEIIEILVSEGDTVEKGQVIARLDDRDQRIALESDEATLRQAQNGLDRARNGQNQAQHNLEQAKAGHRQAEGSMAEAKQGRQQNIDNLKFELENVERQHEDAKKNLERMQTLFEEGLISQQQLEEAQNGENRARIALEQLKLSKAQAESELSLNTLQASVDQAGVNVKIAEASIRDAEIAVRDAQVQVEQAQLAVEMSRKRLEETKITAPVAGQIASIDGQIGGFASNQAAFGRLISVDVIDVEVAVTAEQLILFEIGDNVTVQFAGLASETTGEVTAISLAADESGLFTVTVQIENTEKSIKPGMVASVFVEEVLVEDSVIVPTQAIVERQGNTFMFVVENNIAIQKEIEVIRFDTEHSAIVGPIQPGDKVVVKGQNLLSDGDAIRIVKEDK